MTFKFRKLSDRSPVNDLKDYIVNWLIDNPEDEILISCDSQNRGEKTNYAIVIVFRKKGKGGHVIYATKSFERKMYGKQSGKDFQRLYRESELLSALADFIIENVGRKPDVIALDYNPDPYYFSNQVLLAAIGTLSAKAKSVVGKPNPYAYVADHAVRI